jgi:hypothetical protein
MKRVIWSEMVVARSDGSQLQHDLACWLWRSLLDEAVPEIELVALLN